MKQNVLGDKLHNFQWVGVIWNVVSVFLVGSTAILSGGGKDADDTGAAEGSNALLGVVFVMLGAFVQSMQFVFEEKVLTVSFRKRGERIIYARIVYRFDF
ncbi:MAG: hypothetical protein ACI8RD_007893 [Bacillariaceae sp.]|jgi:hypothetical protein